MEKARRLAACAAAALLGGCTFVWDTAEPSFPLTGDPPSLASLHKLNRAPAGLAAPMTGPEGAPWIAFCEFWSSTGGGGGAGRSCKRMRLVRLGSSGGGAAEEVVTADTFYVHDHVLYEARDHPTEASRTLTLHRPGDPATADVSFTVPLGRAMLYVNDADDSRNDAFVYLVRDQSTTQYFVGHRDPKALRPRSLPPGVDAARLDEQIGFDFVLTDDGTRLVVRAPDGTMTVYSTVGDGAVPLGNRPPAFFIDDARAAVLTVGDDGFRSVPLAGGLDRVLSPRGFDAASLAFADDLVFFARDGALWRVALDGSSPETEVAASAARLVALGLHGEVVYSRDPAGRYVGGAGDGWIGDRKVMERGRLLRVGKDGARLHFLEHAATLGVVGDLTSIGVAGGAPRVLGVNVHAYGELPDGRLLAIENRVYAGAWNRLVAIDEAAGTKRWVVPSATEFLLSPDGREIIADVVSGASGYDIYRVPAP